MVYVYTQLCAILEKEAPSVLAGLPSWATEPEATASDVVESAAENGDSHEGLGDGKENVPPPGDEEEGVVGEGGAVAATGSLARELRQKVFELEGQVFGLEEKLALADDARLATAGTCHGTEGTGSSASLPGRGEACKRRPQVKASPRSRVCVWSLLKYSVRHGHVFCLYDT